MRNILILGIWWVLYWRIDNNLFSYPCGFSEYSEVVHLYTSGIVPSVPDPPMLSEQFVKALTISWIQRPNDETFTLQMEDDATVRLATSMEGMD